MPETANSFAGHELRDSKEHRRARGLRNAVGTRIENWITRIENGRAFAGVPETLAPKFV